MNEEYAIHTCKNCGPKEALLFAPYQLKMKTSYCLKCVAAKRKGYVVPNPFPATAEGYRFDRTYSKSSHES